MELASSSFRGSQEGIVENFKNLFKKVNMATLKGARFVPGIITIKGSWRNPFFCVCKFRYEVNVFSNYMSDQ